MIDLPERIRAPLLASIRAYAEGWDVLAFGSRVNGTGHETSDLDLALRHPSEPERPLKTLPALRAALSESAIPIVIDIHDWAALPAAFRQEIEKKHVKL